MSGSRWTFSGTVELGLAVSLLAGCTSGGERSRSVDASANIAQDCEERVGFTTLCVTFAPEAISPEAERGLDERGFLDLGVFDRPDLPRGSAATLARYHAVFPAHEDAGDELALGDLRSYAIYLEHPPATVFVRALFFDDGGFNAFGGLHSATWLGGIDLSRGLVQDAGLLPVTLAAGGITRLTLPLRALRRLRATVTASATPLGDGQGSISIVASPTAALPPNTTTEGYGIAPCVDVNKGPAVVDVGLLGSGTFYVVGFFDDLGIQTPGSVPPGTMLTLHNVDASTGQGTYDTITVAEHQYSAEIALDLSYVTPFGGGSSTIPPNSCADLGYPTLP